MDSQILVLSFLALHYVIVVSGENETTDDPLSSNEVLFEEYKRHPRETNVVNFVRLLVFRLIYGFAHLLGFGESLSEVGDGAFVPPGAEDDYGIGIGDDFKEYGSDDDDYY